MEIVVTLSVYDSESELNCFNILFCQGLKKMYVVGTHWKGLREIRDKHHNILVYLISVFCKHQWLAIHLLIGAEEPSTLVQNVAI